MFDKIVAITVGEAPSAKKVFPVHKGLLCYYSGYFDKALNGRFKESKQASVKLPTEDVETFQLFIGWIYTRRFDTDDGLDYSAMCQLWAFADRREVPALMNIMIDQIRSRVVATWMVPSANLAYIYENTTEDAGLRRLVVELISVTCGPSLLDASTLEGWCEQAFWDIFHAVWTLKDTGQTKVWTKEHVCAMDLCEFHCHEKGVRCSKSS